MEKFPVTDPDNNVMPMRGYFTRIGGFTIFVWTFMTVFHVTQSSYRLLSSHAAIYPTWYPFDVSARPLYEIANFTQVSLHLYWIHKEHSRNLWLYSVELTKVFLYLIYGKSIFSPNNTRSIGFQSLVPISTDYVLSFKYLSQSACVICWSHKQKANM